MHDITGLFTTRKLPVAIGGYVEAIINTCRKMELQKDINSRCKDELFVSSSISNRIKF
jgi:hypothetical protein